ncbi:MAG: hypothetical protein C0444_03165 [Microbacterium sp.]|nr:hypothetical protein [Microbacterium sp.]MBA4345628.1 hypothetical protein [Microbacterium sp.]
MFGDRIVAQLPSGSEVATFFNFLIAWQLTPDAAISYVAAFFGVVMALAVHFRLLSRGASVLVVVCFSTGVWLALTYRWSNPMPVSTFWADPALWIMLAGLLTPFVLWGAHRALAPTLQKWLDALAERFLDGRTQLAEPLDEQAETIRN